MIENYFTKIETDIQYFRQISCYEINKKIYNSKQGFIRGKIIWQNGNIFEFMEVKNIETKEKVKYRYHYMDKKNNLIFRYDNANHHPKIKTFPHHKHTKDNVIESTEPELFDVLLEILKYEQQ